MQKYRHIVQYYETDKMSVVHHSNYIRWKKPELIFSDRLDGTMQNWSQ